MNLHIKIDGWFADTKQVKQCYIVEFKCFDHGAEAQLLSAAQTSLAIHRIVQSHQLKLEVNTGFTAVGHGSMHAIHDTIE